MRTALTLHPRITESADVETSLSLDRFERSSPSPIREARDPYDWSLDDPGAAMHIEPVWRHPPEDLDPHLVSLRPLLSIRLAATRETRMARLRSLMLGYALIGFLAALSGLTVYAAAIRLPAVQQASIDAEGV